MTNRMDAYRFARMKPEIQLVDRHFVMGFGDYWAVPFWELLCGCWEEGVDWRIGSADRVGRSGTGDRVKGLVNRYLPISQQEFPIRKVCRQFVAQFCGNFT